MFASRLRRLSLCAVCAFAVVGSAVLQAAPSSTSGSCAPAAFTGSVRAAHASACAPKAPVLRGPRGPRGRRGFSGLRGFAGLNGAAGLAGPIGLDGLIGPRGLQGVQGNLGAPGAPGTPGSAGNAGAQGVQGNPGAAGLTGGAGLPGIAGSTGLAGSNGLSGPTGPTGPQGTLGATGSAGAAGATGIAGSTGATGPAAIADFSDFYAMMPPDNAATVAIGAAVQFPQDGPTSGEITRTGASTFTLPNIGTYSVTFSVPVTEAGQLVLKLNGTELANTVYGRATGTTPIAGATLIQTTAINSVLSVDNPSSAAAALTITPLAGGPDPDTATLTIQELS